MTIRIVTDSTCDLPANLVQQYGITVVPLYIQFGEQTFLDGVDISRQEFYQRLPTSRVQPTTATPGVDTFKNIYQRLAESGAREIVSLHISESLSATVNVARQAAAEFRSIPVQVLDSQQLSLGTGLLALAAAQAAQAGQSMAELVTLIEERTRRTHVFAALETMEFLRRSGRMSGVVTRLGNLLRIKPLLKMNRGEPTAERVRTQKRALDRLVQLVTALGPLEQLALVHTNARQTADELYHKARHLFPGDEKPLVVDVTPILGAHLGPGVIGFACVQKP
ncbi:MAG: DegV family protein [Anaerolineales bacterium]|nr:DegV family protein [Anaerolineales bacterium]